jgi:hypothetical protein
MNKFINRYPRAMGKKIIIINNNESARLDNRVQILKRSQDRFKEIKIYISETYRPGKRRAFN